MAEGTGGKIRKAMTEHTIIFTPSGIRSMAEAGENIYDVALRAGVDIQSICGGKGQCRRCQIELGMGKHAKFKLDVKENHLSSLSPTEKRAIRDGDLAQGRRLACRTKICGDVIIEIPSDSREHKSRISKKATDINTALNPAIKLYWCQLPIPTLADNPVDGEALIFALKQFGVTAKPGHNALIKLQKMLKRHERAVIAVVRDGCEVIDIWPPSDRDAYGVALDIGSTSLALYIYNLSTGDLVYEQAEMNPQIRYGEDVMSRVSYIMMNKGGEHRLTGDIRKQIAQMLSQARAALGIEVEQLLELVAVGNPIMHHLFLGINPVELGQAPFTLAVKDWFEAPAHYFDLGLTDAARVACLPLIGGHVGADTTGAYLTQMDRMAGRSVLLVDIGTNAEIILSHGGRIAAASSPTGPAFEGAEISSGVRAATGAIERVRIDPETKIPRVKIIGCEDWLSDHAESHNITGICGSGIFEVMVELAGAGLMDESGLFIPAAAPERFSPEGKSWKYRLINNIYIKQTDIRAVQLAKAALHAGVSLLSEYLGCDELDEVLLAGAFGTHLDPKYVAEIGIIPGASAKTIHSIGNAAGMGAAMTVLNINHKARLIEAVSHIEKIETAMVPKFQDYFVAAMRFPTAPPDTGRNKRRRRNSKGK